MRLGSHPLKQGPSKLSSQRWPVGFTYGPFLFVVGWRGCQGPLMRPWLPVRRPHASNEDYLDDLQQRYKNVLDRFDCAWWNVHLSLGL